MRTRAPGPAPATADPRSDSRGRADPECSRPPGTTARRRPSARGRTRSRPGRAIASPAGIAGEDRRGGRGSAARPHPPPRRGGRAPRRPGPRPARNTARSCARPAGARPRRPSLSGCDATSSRADSRAASNSGRASAGRSASTYSIPRSQMARPRNEGSPGRFATRPWYSAGSDRLQVLRLGQARCSARCASWRGTPWRGRPPWRSRDSPGRIAPGVIGNGPGPPGEFDAQAGALRSRRRCRRGGGTCGPARPGPRGRGAAGRGTSGRSRERCRGAAGQAGAPAR